jgi:Cullin binding
MARFSYLDILIYIWTALTRQILLQVRGIPRDTWNMFLNFVTSVGTDLSLYDDTEAWPSLLDDFVEFENDQLNQNSSAMQDLNRENSLTPS